MNITEYIKQVTKKDFFTTCFVEVLQDGREIYEQEKVRRRKNIRPIAYLEARFVFLGMRNLEHDRYVQYKLYVQLLPYLFLGHSRLYLDCTVLSPRRWSFS